MSGARLRPIREVYRMQDDPGEVWPEAVNDLECVWHWVGGSIAKVHEIGTVMAIERGLRDGCLPWAVELVRDRETGGVYAVRLED